MKRTNVRELRPANALDPLTIGQRAECMRRIGPKDTKPELILRRGLHKRGWRYRLHGNELPGRPDLVFASRRAVIFVHGCYWHAHGCHLSRLPKTRRAYWTEKLSRNQLRDEEAARTLIAQGYRVLNVWECSIVGREKLPLRELLDEVDEWLNGALGGLKNIPGMF